MALFGDYIFQFTLCHNAFFNYLIFKNKKFILIYCVYFATYITITNIELQKFKADKKKRWYNKVDFFRFLILYIPVIIRLSYNVCKKKSFREKNFYILILFVLLSVICLEINLHNLFYILLHTIGYFIIFSDYRYTYKYLLQKKK